ncbi:MAG: 3-dehydroquinate synthase II, partial [Acidobacteriota bacterium]
MKEAWIVMEEWSKELVTTALENGADALVLPPGFSERVKALGRIATVSEDGDIKPGEDVFFETLASPEDEARIASLLLRATVALTGDRAWEIIPLENLVAGGGKLLVPVRSIEELDLALGILEKGVAGVVIHPTSPEALIKLLSRIKAVSATETLKTAVIESIRPVGIGDRVCVDTCTLMQEGEGLLVGNSSGFLFLVQAEAKPNPYVAPRPFRVNAGPVHLYVKVQDGRTRYLSELS